MELWPTRSVLGWHQLQQDELLDHAAYSPTDPQLKCINSMKLESRVKLWKTVCGAFYFQKKSTAEDEIGYLQDSSDSARWSCRIWDLENWWMPVWVKLLIYRIKFRDSELTKYLDEKVSWAQWTNKWKISSSLEKAGNRTCLRKLFICQFDTLE